jgi:hypothetical protein
MRSEQLTPEERETLYSLNMPAIEKLVGKLFAEIDQLQKERKAWYKALSVSSVVQRQSEKIKYLQSMLEQIEMEIRCNADKEECLRNIGRIIGQIEGGNRMVIQQGTKINFTYTNWRGETSKRRAIVLNLLYGSTEYHPEPQWLLKGFDLDKDAIRIYAIRDMKDVVVI